jgi:phosphatidylinositol alpha-mannosyltransferase
VTVRVALLHPYCWPSVRRGGERYLHDLARWLRGRGHEVTLVTGGDTDDPGAVKLPLRGPALDTFGAAVLPHLMSTRYDVVHALVPSAALAAVATLQPSAYTVLGHPSADNLPRPRWRRELFVRAVRSARSPMALSASAADGAAQVAGRRPLVVPPGLFSDGFPPRQGVPAGPPSLLFNAFAEDWRKRLHVLLAALPDVLDAHPSLTLRLGGGGDPSESLDQLDPGVRKAVEPCLRDLGTGELTDVPDRYREATVTVLPSVDEAFGLVLVESLASGTPVVCSRSGGMPEIVDDDRVGRVVEPDQPHALAKGVLAALELAQQPETAAVCAAHARRWDWDVVGPLHEQAYARARG